MIFGKGVFGVFSTAEKAAHCKEDLAQENGCFCEVKRVSVIDSCHLPATIFAAHTYDELYDCHTLDGLYSQQDIAFDAAGSRGLVVEFVVDTPGIRKVRVVE